MHFSSLRKFEAFVETYIKPMPDLGSLRVLDIGSRQTREGLYPITATRSRNSA